jgi:hypothetical protein
VAGSDLAIHCPAWTEQQAERFEQSLFETDDPGDFDPWETSSPRG